MDIINNPFFFFADLFVFYWFCGMYNVCTETLTSMQTAPVFGTEVEKVLRTGGHVPYCIVEGGVTALDTPIQSALKPGEAGVVQRLKITRFVVSNDFLGILKHKSETVVEDTVRVSRFGIEAGAAVVELTETYAAYLDPWNMVKLDKVADLVKAGAANGSLNQHGMHFKEEMLKEGSYLMAFGELMFDGDVISLVPARGQPTYYMTSWPRANFIKWMQVTRNVYKSVLLVSGALAFLLLGRYCYRLKQNYEAEQNARAQPSPPTLVAGPDAPEVQLCVVCRYYARDVILMPCRHFAVCQDCLPSIQARCPVCRSPYSATVAVFVA